jgi:hypothetical protein
MAVDVLRQAVGVLRQAVGEPVEPQEPLVEATCLTVSPNTLRWCGASRDRCFDRRLVSLPNHSNRLRYTRSLSLSKRPA